MKDTIHLTIAGQKFHLTREEAAFINQHLRTALAQPDLALSFSQRRNGGSATGFCSSKQRRTSAHRPMHGAFFMPAVLSRATACQFYGGRCAEAERPAGSFGRSANRVPSVTSFCSGAADSVTTKESSHVSRHPGSAFALCRPHCPSLWRNRRHPRLGSLPLAGAGRAPASHRQSARRLSPDPFKRPFERAPVRPPRSVRPRMRMHPRYPRRTTA